MLDSFDTKFKASGVTEPKTPEEALNEKYENLQREFQNFKEKAIAELGQVVKMVQTGKSKEEIMQEESTIIELEKQVGALTQKTKVQEILINGLQSQYQKLQEKQKVTEFVLLDKFSEYDDIIGYCLSAKIPPPIYAVHHYQADPYYGQGQLIICTVGRKYYFVNLEHCSCYSPLDNKFTETTIDEILNSSSIHDMDISDDIRAKIREIEGV